MQNHQNEPVPPEIIRMMNQDALSSYCRRHFQHKLAESLASYIQQLKIDGRTFMRLTELAVCLVSDEPSIRDFLFRLQGKDPQRVRLVSTPPRPPHVSDIFLDYSERGLPPEWSSHSHPQVKALHVGHQYSQSTANTQSNAEEYHDDSDIAQRTVGNSNSSSEKNAEEPTESDTDQSDHGSGVVQHTAGGTNPPTKENTESAGSAASPSSLELSPSLGEIPPLLPTVYTTFIAPSSDISLTDHHVHDSSSVEANGAGLPSEALAPVSFPLGPSAHSLRSQSHVSELVQAASTHPAALEPETSEDSEWSEACLIFPLDQREGRTARQASHAEDIDDLDNERSPEVSDYTSSVDAQDLEFDNVDVDIDDNDDSDSAEDDTNSDEEELTFPTAGEEQKTSMAHYQRPVVDSSEVYLELADGNSNTDFLQQDVPIHAELSALSSPLAGISLSPLHARGSLHIEIPDNTETLLEEEEDTLLLSTRLPGQKEIAFSPQYSPVITLDIPIFSSTLADDFASFASPDVGLGLAALREKNIAMDSTRPNEPVRLGHRRFQSMADTEGRPMLFPRLDHDREQAENLRLLRKRWTPATTSAAIQTDGTDWERRCGDLTRENARLRRELKMSRAKIKQLVQTSSASRPRKMSFLSRIGSILPSLPTISQSEVTLRDEDLIPRRPYATTPFPNT